MSRILIVEDEEAIADLEKDYLELSDFEVAIENTGDAGLQTALAEDFDLIIGNIIDDTKVKEEVGIDLCESSGTLAFSEIRRIINEKKPSSQARFHSSTL